uniref:Putative ovule protein n=1 Tax=Solanum chacoense TaxID=4108 RepID=A0A0V0HMJ6_SOLCH
MMCNSLFNYSYMPFYLGFLRPSKTTRLILILNHVFSLILLLLQFSFTQNFFFLFVGICFIISLVFIGNNFFISKKYGYDMCTLYLYPSSNFTFENYIYFCLMILLFL